MVDNKSKTSLIRHTQKNTSLMTSNNIILVLCSLIILSSLVICFFCICHFLLPHAVFDPYLGYTDIYIYILFFLYNGVSVSWIIKSVYSFRFFNQYLKNYVTHKYVLYMAQEKSFHSASTRVCCIHIHAEMTEKFLYSLLSMLLDRLFRILSINIDLFNS